MLIGMLTLVLMMSAAFAVDLGLQINRKQLLVNTLDSAAQVGASMLRVKSRADIEEKVRQVVEDAYPKKLDGSDPPVGVDFWCVVASRQTAGGRVVKPGQIPNTCYPGPEPYTPADDYRTTGRKVACSETICAIPCVEPVPNTGTPKIACNTIRVFQGRDVPFQFAPAGGISKGSTGNLMSVACKGSCGSIAPNPMDVAVVADRTVSMGDADIASMVSGIKSMLQVMTPDQQYVALGTIGRSAAATTSQGGTCQDGGGLTMPSDSGSSGKWVPLSFSDDYVDASANLRTNSPLVRGVSCLTNKSRQELGTSLAAPMKAAARYLIGSSGGGEPNNLSSLPVRTDPVTKVLIFETDGEPNEREPSGGSSSLSDAGDGPFSNVYDVTPPGPPVSGADTSASTTATNTPSAGKTTITKIVTHNKTITQTYIGGNKACDNLLAVATQAKAAGIRVISVGYNMNNKFCNFFDGVNPSYDGSVRTGPTPNFVTEVDPAATTTVVSGNTTTITKYQTTTVTKYVRGPNGRSVLSVLAEAASPISGVPSAANTACATVADRDSENADGDNLFCAASGSSMASIFTTALAQVSKGIKLMKLP